MPCVSVLTSYFYEKHFKSNCKFNLRHSYSFIHIGLKFKLSPSLPRQTNHASTQFPPGFFISFKHKSYNNTCKRIISQKHMQTIAYESWQSSLSQRMSCNIAIPHHWHIHCRSNLNLNTHIIYRLCCHYHIYFYLHYIVLTHTELKHWYKGRSRCWPHPFNHIHHPPRHLAILPKTQKTK